jgi:short-subunit dehydrogenase
MERIADTIKRSGGSARVETADARNREEFRGAIERLEGHWGRVDLLVANAGIGLNTSVAEYSVERLEEIIDVNLLSAAVAIGCVLPGMLERGIGRIVGISSLAAYRGLPTAAGYCASKAGLTAFLEGLRAELRLRGVGVTIVHPGYVRTPMIAWAASRLPFEMEVGRACRRIVSGIERGQERVDFPWPLATLLRISKLLPARWSDALILRGAMREQRVEEQ